MRNKFFGLFLSVLLISGVVEEKMSGVVNASEAASDRADLGRQESVRGLLDEFGPGFVVVEGIRYKTAPRLEIKNQLGEVSTSMKELRPHTMLELVLEGHLVVRIQIVGLPR